MTFCRHCPVCPFQLDGRGGTDVVLAPLKGLFLLVTKGDPSTQVGLTPTRDASLDLLVETLSGRPSW
jgi:hypothetical protein